MPASNICTFPNGHPKLSRRLRRMGSTGIIGIAGEVESNHGKFKIFMNEISNIKVLDV